MFAHHVSRASRRLSISSISRVSGGNATVQVRGFIAPTVSRRADYVQELYLKELKAYKPAPVKESDADGQVQKFSLPKAPASPEEADLASSLKEYESMAVDVEGAGAAGSAPGTAAALPDWLEEEPEQEAHHH